MRRGVGLESVALLNFAAATRDMHLGLADFHVGKLGGGLFQDWVVGLAGFAGGQAVGDDRRGRVGELLVIFVSDVFDDPGHFCRPKSSRHKSESQKTPRGDFRLSDFMTEIN